MNGIATITIAGQKVGLKFGLPALRRVMEKLKQYEIEIGGKLNDLAIAHILYAGYLNHCLMKDEVIALEFQPFYEYTENVGDTEESKAEVLEAMKSWEASKAVRDMVEEGKKKATMEKAISTGMKSNPSATAISVIPPPIITD